MKNIASPIGFNIMPGSIHTITTAKSESQRIAKEKAADKALFKKLLGLPKSETQHVIFPGTLHSGFIVPTGRVSVSEAEVRKTHALAEKAIAEGRIPPKAGQGGFLDVVI